MVMKSIFTVSCFVVMALAIGTEKWTIPPIKVIHLIEDMNATCESLKNGNPNLQRVNEVDFPDIKNKMFCKKEVYQDTFCQINKALLSCKGYNVSRFLSDFHDDKCTSKKGSLVPLKDFCSNMLRFLKHFYRICATINMKRI